MGVNSEIQYPVSISNVFSENYFILLNDELKPNSPNWELNNTSYIGGKLSWNLDKSLLTNLSFISCASILKLKLQKIIKKNLKLCKIHTNGQTSNQVSEFHKDFIFNDTWTFILFCGYQWDTSWGGEFVCFDEQNKKYHYSPFIPNTGILIPANWDHFGNCPNSSTDNLRITVAFSFCDALIYDDIINCYPNLKVFY